MFFTKIAFNTAVLLCYIPHKRGGNSRTGALGAGAALTMTCRTIDEVVGEISRRIPQPGAPINKARAAYDWMVTNIQYDHHRLNMPFRREILPPEETLHRGKGICTDMSALYVVVTRQMGLQSNYANVEVDQNNNPVEHACAVVDLPERKLQVDPAYRIFDARHIQLRIHEPPEVASTHTVPRQPIHLPRFFYHPIPFKKLAIAGLAAIGISCCAYLGISGAKQLKPTNIQYYQTGNGVRFTTKHGTLNFGLEESARIPMEKALFYHEAQNSDMDPGELLEMYVSTDKDDNERISAQEAIDARISARKSYMDSVR